MMNSIKIYTIAFMGIIAFSCGNDKKQTVTEPEVISVETKFEHKAAEIDATFEDEKLAAVFSDYVKLKTALVNTDPEVASKEASNLMTAFANLGVDESLMMSAQKISESKDVEEQRTVFVKVTGGVEGLLTNALESGAIYKQYCPMAFGNTGAYWLSESKEIANPYFGDKMYRCGRIDATIE